MKLVFFLLTVLMLSLGVAGLTEFLSLTPSNIGISDVVKLIIDITSLCWAYYFSEKYKNFRP